MSTSTSAMRGAITEDDRNFVETWENISATQNAIIRLDVRGDERPEVISGPRTFMITTQERLITQDRIVVKERDPFTNGAFRPVVVPDSVTVDTNPNALSDDEIRSIFVSSDVAWGEWMKVIDSPETLRRMLDLAGGEDTDISLKRYKQIAGRLAEVKPKTQITQRDREQYEKIGGEAPPSPSRRGGRSGGYRSE